MNQKDLVEKWLGRIDSAQKAREDAEADWEKNRQMMQASSYKDLPKPYARVWVNLMLAIVRSMLPNLYYKAPEFTALPMRPQDEKNFEVAQEVLNYYARTCGLKPEMKKVVMDGLICTFGVLKVGWVFEDVDVELEVDGEPDDESAQIRVVDNSEEYPLSAVRRDLFKGGIGLRPFCARVSPWNFVRNRGSTSLKNATWVAERIFLPLDEVKNDPQYKNKGDLRSNAVPSLTASQSFGEGYLLTDGGTDQYIAEGRALSDPDDDLVEIWEIWDRATMKRIVLARGASKPLVYKDWPYDLDGRFPYVELQFNQVPDEPYAISYCSMFREIIQQINIISSYELEFVKRSVGHLAINSTAVDQLEVEKLRSGEPVGVVFCNADPNGVFASVGGVPINPDLKWVHAKAESNLQGISNVPDFLRGEQAPQGQLATVAKLQAAGTSMTVSEMQDVVSDALVEWAELVDMMAKQLCDKKTAIRIAAEDGFAWKDFNKEDIQGRYEYSIIPGSMLPQNEDVQQQQALSLLNLSAPFIAPGSLQVNGAVLYNEILRKYKFPNSKKILGIEPPPVPRDPNEENWDMETGGEPPVSPREDLQGHKQSHVAYLQEIMQRPNADPAHINRVLNHLNATDAMILQLQIQQQLQAQRFMEALSGGQPQGPPGAPPEPQPGQPQRGPGNGGPMKNGPARPRMLQQKAPNMDHLASSAQRSGPRVPGTSA